MTEQRHDAIRALDSASFQAQFAQQDIEIFKLATYELASAHDVLSLVVTDNDMGPLQIGLRAPLLVQPPRPGIAATQPTVNAYKIAHELWQAQHKGMQAVKTAMLAALDKRTKAVVSDRVHGTLQRTPLQILNLLIGQYHAMSNEELRAYKQQWEAMRWNQGDDLLIFIADFKEAVRFLETHDYGPPRGEQVTKMLAAVDHVPGLSTPTKAAFYQAVPAVADQTLTTLCTHMTTVYRTQYVSATASEHHEMNQVTIDTPNPNDDVIAGIAASARATLRGEVLTAAQLDKIQVAVTQAIRTCLSPAAPTTRGPQARTTEPRRRNTKPMEKDECPYHRGARHTWEQCNQNPNRQDSKK
jgi:hypothetical protein